MKTVFTSMLLFVMTVSQALPSSIDSIDKGKSTPTTTPTTSTVSMQQLQDENAQLKARLANLEATIENDKALLEFRFTMKQVLVSFEDEKQNDRYNQMEALSNYNKLMGVTLLKFKSNTAR